MVLDIFFCLANRADSISFIAFSLLLDIFFLEIPKTGKNFLYFSTFITLFTEFLHSSSTLWNPNTCRKNISCCIHQFKNLAATNFFRLIYRILQILYCFCCILNAGNFYGMSNLTKILFQQLALLDF